MRDAGCEECEVRGCGMTEALEFLPGRYGLTAQIHGLRRSLSRRQPAKRASATAVLVSLLGALLL
jgi:hypothetical protein